MILSRLHHAQLTIPRGEEAKARDFYSGVLGLHEVPKPAALAGRGGFWLRLGELQIHVGVEDEAPTASKAHLAYEVTDLAHWRARLSAAGYPPLDGIPLPGYARFELRDPFGNRLELLQRTEVVDGPRLRTARLELRLVAYADVPAVIEYFRRNRAHIEPAGTFGGPVDPFEPVYWREYAVKSMVAYEQDREARLLAFENDSLVATVNFTQIFRGVMHGAYLGYTVDQAREGQGIMSEALEAAIAYAFGPLNLHRISANYQPWNVRSARVLERLGFRIDGETPAYLRFGGEWRDHVLTSRVNPAWRAPAP